MSTLNNRHSEALLPWCWENILLECPHCSCSHAPCTPIYMMHFSYTILSSFPVSLPSHLLFISVPSNTPSFFSFSFLLWLLVSLSKLLPCFPVRMLWAHIICGWVTPNSKGLLLPQVNHFALLLSRLPWVPQCQSSRSRGFQMSMLYSQTAMNNETKVKYKREKKRRIIQRLCYNRFSTRNI